MISDKERNRIKKMYKDLNSLIVALNSSLNYIHQHLTVISLHASTYSNLITKFHSSVVMLYENYSENGASDYNFKNDVQNTYKSIYELTVFLDMINDLIVSENPARAFIEHLSKLRKFMRCILSDFFGDFSSIISPTNRKHKIS